MMKKTLDSKHVCMYVSEVGGGGLKKNGRRGSR